MKNFKISIKIILIICIFILLTIFYDFVIFYILDLIFKFPPKKEFDAIFESQQFLELSLLELPILISISLITFGGLFFWKKNIRYLYWNFPFTIIILSIYATIRLFYIGILE